MFTNLIDSLRQAGLPISITEYLALIEAVDAGISQYSVEDFYYLSRATLVKDERHLDRFDRIFGEVFKGLESSADLDGIVLDVPDEWLKTLSQLMLSEEEKAKIDALGGWEKLMDTLRERLNEQKKKHTGGSKWIGTAGTSRFGAYGYNPEGIRIGQHESRNRRAVKVWDKRQFANLDDQIELGTRR